MSKLQAALQWADRGFRCFPLQVNGKKPLWEGWPELATTDHDQIRRWWSNPVYGENDFNIGCVPDGLVVDIDVKDGKDGLAGFLDIGGTFDTLTVRTPSGGFHLYYTATPTANTAGTLAAGVDTRSTRGYVVAPGSNIDDNIYALVLDAPIAPAPHSFIAKLSAPRERDADQTSLVEEDTPSALALGRLWLSDNPGAAEGGRHNHTYATAAYLRDLGISETLAGELMLEEWSERPLDEEVTLGCVADAYRYAQNAPGSKHPAASFAGVVLPPTDIAGVLRDLGFGDDTSWAAQTLSLHNASSPMPEGHRGLGPTANNNPFEEFGNTPPIAEIPARPWLVNGWLLRKETTVLAARGGVGKSLLSLSMAIDIAAGSETVCGRINAQSGNPQKVIVYNAEDSTHEMAMRLYAQCEVMKIDPAVVTHNIVLVSGRDFELLLMEGDRNPEVTDRCKAGIELLINAARRHGAAMIVLDPLAKLHHVNENDNATMSRLIGNINKIAELTNAAVLLLHHKAKGNKTGEGRGAGSIEDSVRVHLSMASPDEEEAIPMGLTAAQAREYVGVYDGKMNRSLASEKIVWLKKHGIHLANGETVGALALGDTMDASKENGRLIGDALEMAFRNSGTASMSLTHATAVMHQADPVLDHLSANVTEIRLRLMVEHGLIVATTGVKFAISAETGRKQIVMT